MARVKFAVIVDGEVASTIEIEEESPIEGAQRSLAAFRSNPIIIESPMDVTHGWTYDGTTFHEPVKE